MKASKGENEMKEYKPFKSGKVRELYDLATASLWSALTAFRFDNILKDRSRQKASF